MQSNGGLIDVDAAAGHAVLDGAVRARPAAPRAPRSWRARPARTDALCFDMGGTSCDVCVVDGGAVQERSSGEIAGRPLALPMLAVHTVGAGGGSIAWRDAGGALRVGPRSAGADPGPACYGRGGTEPTVTDANLRARLPVRRRAAGRRRRARPRRGRARGRRARRRSSGSTSRACAEGIVRVANAEMIRALRVVTVQRGIDPRRYALLAFGGAGAAARRAIADELGIDDDRLPARLRGAGRARAWSSRRAGATSSAACC